MQRLDPPAINRLKDILVPTLVILGSLDQPSIQEIAGLIVREVARARLRKIGGAAHMVNMEKPGEFNRIVESFLREVK